VSGAWANTQHELARPKLQHELVNPYLCVVGAPRSRTTRMLDAHRRLAVVNDMRWLPRKSRERPGLTHEGLETDSLLLASPNLSRPDPSVQDLALLPSEEQSVRHKRFVARTFDIYAARQGRPPAGDKTPRYVRRMAQIHELPPQARFVHIIRAPGDVHLSMRDWRSGEQTARQNGTWNMDPVVSTALSWRLRVARVEADEPLGPDLYHQVRYEKLVASLEHELKRICEFRCLSYAEAMMRPC
jgi:hypothetical protein